MAAPISKEEWVALRAEARFVIPEQLQGKNLPDVLIPYQQRLLQTTATSRVTVVEKSRRTGYTWGVGADAVLTSAAARGAGGMDTLYIGYPQIDAMTLHQVEELFAYWRKHPPTHELAAAKFNYQPPKTLDERWKEGAANPAEFFARFQKTGGKVEGVSRG